MAAGVQWRVFFAATGAENAQDADNLAMVGDGLGDDEASAERANDQHTAADADQSADRADAKPDQLKRRTVEIEMRSENVSGHRKPIP
jgi:hypothetical protein